MAGEQKDQPEIPRNGFTFRDSCYSQYDAIVDDPSSDFVWIILVNTNHEKQLRIGYRHLNLKNKAADMQRWSAPWTFSFGLPFLAAPIEKPDAPKLLSMQIVEESERQIERCGNELWRQCRWLPPPWLSVQAAELVQAKLISITTQLFPNPVLRTPSSPKLLDVIKS